jgi:hypothetical protein
MQEKQTLIVRKLSAELTDEGSEKGSRTSPQEWPLYRLRKVGSCCAGPQHLWAPTALAWLSKTLSSLANLKNIFEDFSLVFKNKIKARL